MNVAQILEKDKEYSQKFLVKKAEMSKLENKLN